MVSRVWDVVLEAMPASCLPCLLIRSYNSKPNGEGLEYYKTSRVHFYSWRGIAGNYTELIDEYYGFIGLFGQCGSLVLVVGNLTCDAFSSNHVEDANTYNTNRLKRKTMLWLSCSLLTVRLREWVSPPLVWACPAL